MNMPMGDMNPMNRVTTSFSNMVSGRWAPDEHDRFMEALSKFGNDWKAVAEHVRTRTMIQVRSHAQKYFAKLKKNQTVNMTPTSESIRESGKPVFLPINEQGLGHLHIPNRGDLSSKPKEKKKQSFPTSILQQLQRRESIISEIKKRGDDVSRNSQLIAHDDHIYIELKQNLLNSKGDNVQSYKEVASWVLHALNDQISLKTQDINNLIQSFYPNLQPCEVIPYNRLDVQDMEISDLEKQIEEFMLRRCDSRPKPLSEDEKRGVSLLASLNKRSTLVPPIDLSAQSMNMRLNVGNPSPRQPNFPICLVTFRKQDLIAYEERYKSICRPDYMDSSSLYVTFPVSTNNPTYVMYQRNYVDVESKPIGELISPTTNEAMGYLIPTTTNNLNAPHVILLASPHSSSPNYYTYSLNLPIQESRDA